jgi:hypothetical protein
VPAANTPQIGRITAVQGPALLRASSSGPYLSIS